MEELDTSCKICNGRILTRSIGEPHLRFKNKYPICFTCYLDLIEEIYRMSGHGDGGIIHLLFQSCLSLRHNRKKRIQLKQYKKTMNLLLEKYCFRCVLCKSKEKLTVDHIQPVSKGGTDDPSNLQILCKPCNSKKGNSWSPE